MANFITGFLNRLLNPHRTGEQYTNAAVDALLGLSSSGQSQYDESLQTNIQEAEKNRLFQRQMVQEEREYNTPAAQMARARAAGLNPSLLYGQPISEAGSAPAGSEASVGMGSSGDLSRLITSAPSMLAQIDLMHAQAEEIRSRIPLNQQRVNEVIYRALDLQASVDERRARAALMLSQKGLTDEQKANIGFEQSIKNGYLDLERQKFELLSNKTDAEIKKINAEEKALLSRAAVTDRELQEMIWTYAVRRAGLEKQNNLTDAQIAQANATADKLRKEGVRVDQLISQDTNRTMTKEALRNAASSSNPVESIVGSLIMSVDYCADKLLGAVLK